MALRVPPDRSLDVVGPIVEDMESVWICWGICWRFFFFFSGGFFIGFNSDVVFDGF